MYNVIQFYVWNCVEKQNGENWELLSFEAGTVWNGKIHWNNPQKKNLTLAGSSVTAACGEEKTFEYTLTVDENLGWKWSDQLLEQEKDQLSNFFWLNDFDGWVEFTGYTFVNDREIRVQGKLNSGRDQDIPVSLCAANLFIDGDGNRIWGNLYTKDQDTVRIVIGNPHKFEINGYNNGYFKLWKGTEQDVDDELLHGGESIPYEEKEGGGYELQKFTLRKENTQGDFRGVWLYPNNAASEFYPLGSEVIEDKGNGVYEITLDPNSYLSGASVRFFTEALPYDGQLIPCFDAEKEGTSVTWTEEDGDTVALESGTYVDFTVSKAQTFTVTAPAENGFYGVEVFYADPKNGPDSVFVPASDSRFTHDDEEHTWTVELFDGKDNKPVSGYWLHVYWSEEEYNYEHLTDGNWSEDHVLVTVSYYAYDRYGNVTVDGKTGYSRYGETRYLVKKTELASGLPLTVEPAENYKLRWLEINGGNYTEQASEGHLTYTWDGNTENISVGVGFEANFSDLGEHITIWDTRITAKAGETFTAHLYLALDTDCGYTWAAEEPDGFGEAISLNTPGYGSSHITYWHVSEDDPKLLELRLTGLCNSVSRETAISVTVIRGLLNSASEPVTGGELRSHYNSNAQWNIFATEGMTIESGASIEGVSGVFTDPQQFVLKLNDGYKWSEDIRIMVNKRSWIFANCNQTEVEFVSVNEDRTELTILLSGKTGSSKTEPVVIWANGECVLDANDKTVGKLLATEQREDINWIITNRGGLTVEDAVLNGRAGESKLQTITLKLDAASDMTFDADELAKVDENKADLGNYISFNGNPLWWEFTDYELVNERELCVTFDLNVPYARIHDPLHVFVNTIISGSDGLMAAEDEDAYWNIRWNSWFFGINGMENPTGILYGETKTFSIERDGYEGQIDVAWSVTGDAFELSADGESATVTALAGESAEGGELKAVISYDYDEETHTYGGQETLTETLYVKRSFTYSGLEADVNVLEKSHTIHAEVENPSELTVNSVTWEVLPLDGEEDTRITVAPIADTDGMEAVIAANAPTGSSCAKVKVTVAYQIGEGPETTESYTASVNVYEGTENTFRITYDPNGGTGIVTTEYVKAGETAVVRKLTCTKDRMVANCWTDEAGNRYWAQDTFVPEADMTLKAHWVVNGWNEEDGEWYYYRGGERVCCEWVESNNQLFWLNEEGRLSPNTRVELGGVPFCTDESGAMITNGWGLDIQGHVTSPMYLNDAGVALGAFGEEQAKIGGKVYDFDGGLVWNDYVLNLQVGAEADEDADYIVYLLDGNPAGVTLPVSEKEGCRFDGWFTEITGGEEVEDDDLAEIADHSRFYAHWTEVAEAEVTIIYKEQNLADPEEYDEISTEIITGIVGEMTAVTAPERIGFTAETIEQQRITVSGAEVEVRYERNSYGFEYTSKRGAEYPESCYYGEAIELPEEELYQEEGKTFLGWYQDGERFQEGDTMPAFDLELTPLWAEGEDSWIWDGAGWKYADPLNIYGEDGAADKLIGIPETDPEFWYYVDEYGHMVQNYVVYLDGGSAAFGADGKRLYDSWITVPSSQRDFFDSGLTVWTGYADEHGWLIAGQLKTLGGVTYGFDSNGRMAIGYTDEEFNILSGESCIDDSVYYFIDNGSLVTNCFMEFTEYHRDYETCDRIFTYFGYSGRKLSGTTKVFSEGEETISCSFDEKGVLSSGVTVTYARGYESDRTTTMDDRFIPVLPGMTGASLDGNLYDRPGYYFDRWKAADETAYADRRYLSADEIKALYKTEGKKLELTAQWTPVQWTVELPELEHASIALTEDSTRETGTKVTFTVTPDTGYYVNENTLAALEISWIGLEKRDAEDHPITVSLTKEADNTWSFTMPVSRVRIDAETEADTGVTYKYEFWYQGTDGVYVRNDDQTVTRHDGVTGEVPEFENCNLVKGFYMPASLENIPVAGDGSTVYKYEYPREILKLVLTEDDGVASVTGAAESIYYDQEVTVSAVLKTGYHMVGWKYKDALKSADLSYTFHMPAEEDLTEEEGNVYELTAESQINTYKVVFNKNSEDAAGTMEDQSFTYGTAAELRTNAFTKTGYTFAGWMTEAGKTSADYEDGQEVNNLTAEHEGTVTLYALWEAGESTAYKVEHYKQNLTDENYTLEDTDNRTGRTGSEVTPAVKNYSGFTAPAVQTETVLADGSLTVKYYYTRNSYVLTLEKETGIETVTGAGTYKYEEERTVTAAVKEGYSFTGWTKGETGVSENAEYTFSMPAEALTLKANAEAHSYTVKFNANTGSGTMADQSFTYDAAAKALTANTFTKEGYHFAGWALTAEGETEYADKAEVQNLSSAAGGEVTLYAKWTANSYTVRFSANGGTGTMAPESFTYDAEAKALTENAFTRTGYTFAGWALTAEGEAEYADKAEVQNLTKVKDGEFVLYAKWTANSYTVKFNANTGSGEMEDQPFTYDEAAKALTENIFTKTGYHFAGWAESADGAKKYADAASVQNLTAAAGATVTLYAVWKANTWKVRFNANAGTGTMEEESFTYDVQKALTSLGFSRQGYTFSKWTVDEAGEGQSYANREKVKNLKSGEGDVLNLYAQWIPNEDTAYQVKHYLEKLEEQGEYGTPDRIEGRYGTTGALTDAKAKYYEGFEAQAITQETIAADGSTVIDVKYSRKQYTVTFTDGVGQQYVRYEGTVSEPDDPEKENYTFVNWYADETYLEVWDFGENVITGATTIYAKWIPKTKRLTLNANGGMVSPEEKYVKFEGTYEDLPTPARTGYGFDGWYTEAEGGELVNNLTEVADTADQTLYAHWESGKYTVSFNAGEGSVTGGADTKLVEYDYEYGVLPAAERKGYEFRGWFTESTGGTQITAATIVKITEDQTLYAQYTVVNYTITYECVDGAENPNPATYTINDQVDFKEPKKTGYVFAGWDMVLDGKPMGREMMEPSIRAGKTGPVTMTANWTEYEPQQNEVKQSSEVEQQAKENEDVEKVAEEVRTNNSAKKETENLEKALDADKLLKFARLETGNTGKEVEKVEMYLELKLENVTVQSGTGDPTLKFEVTPKAVFRAADDEILAENVPVGDDVLNKEERFTFRMPVPASVNRTYAKVKHTTESGDELSIHQILTDTVTGEKYIEYNAITTSPFEMSFTDTAYTLTGPGTYTCTGSEICPEVTVKETASGTVLTENKDYTVAYENNIQPGTAKVIVTILASGLTVEKEFTITQKKDNSGSSSGSSSGNAGGGSSAGPGGSAAGIPSWVEKNGTWSQDAKGNWSYTSGGVVYKNKWACVYNPYANTKAGQKVYDWFHFDGNGIMQTGWFTDTDGNIYYLNPVADGSRGRMFTGWHQIEGKWYYFSEKEGSGTMGALYRNTTTPDGYKVDAKGVWIK